MCGKGCCGHASSGNALATLGVLAATAAGVAVVVFAAEHTLLLAAALAVGMVLVAGTYGLLLRLPRVWHHAPERRALPARTVRALPAAAPLAIERARVVQGLILDARTAHPASASRHTTGATTRSTLAPYRE